MNDTFPQKPTTGFFSRGKVFLAAALLLGAALRLLYFTDLQHNPLVVMTSRDPVFDQHNFISLAEDILAHGGLGSKLIFQSAAYPYLIAVVFKLFGPQLNSLFLFQMAVGILGIYLLYRLTAVAFTDKRAGLIAAFLAAGYGPFIYYEGAVLRDLLIAYMHLIGCSAVLRAVIRLRKRDAFLAGLALGGALILRPTVIVLLIPAAFFWMEGTARKRLTLIAVMTAGLLTAVVPLAVRNAWVGGQRVLIESSEPGTFWTGNAPDSVGFGSTMYTPLQKELIAEAGGRLAGIARVWSREVRRHPGEYLQLYARKFRMVFNGFEIPANLSYDLFKENSPWLKRYVLDFRLVSPLALLGLVLAAGKHRRARVLYVSFFLMALFIMTFHVQSRYRLSLVPFAIPFAAYALHWLGGRLARREWKPIGAALVVLVPLALWTAPARVLVSQYFGAQIRSIDYGNMAGAYLYVDEAFDHHFAGMGREDLLRKALENYQKAGLTAAPEERPVWILNVGLMHRELGEVSEARAALQTVLLYDPGNPQVEQLLAEIGPAPGGR